MLTERTPDFPLTQTERELLATIAFDVPEGDEAVKRNGQAVCALMKSLIARKAIPELRVKWFTDPAYFPGGRGKSRKQMFERNGCIGDEIFRHPHFLEYLRTFLYGANLPATAIAQFREAVVDCGQVTSGDIVPLGKKARDIARARTCGPQCLRGVLQARARMRHLAQLRGAHS